MEHIKRSFKVSLDIKHPTIDPASISRTLSLSPYRQSQVGEQKVTPSGTPLRGNYLFSSWGYEFDANAIADLTAFLPSIIEQLKPHASYFETLVREGGSVELFCGIFADGNWDESFHHSLLRKLAEMAIDLRLDVYPKPDEPEV
jgi:hypothetical protein